MDYFFFEIWRSEKRITLSEKKATFKESQEANSAFENVRKKEDLQLLQMKTEVKVEVKEETIEDFDAQEQIGIDLITNQDFDYA